MTLKALNPFKKSVPIRRESENPFSLLRRELDHLFDEFMRDFEIDSFFDRRGRVFTPKIDVTENDKEIKVTAELPGIDEKDIEVTLNRDSLTIKGEKREEKEDKGRDYYRMERTYGSFCRTIPLPVEVETDKAEAYYKKGVLTVRIPKSPEAIEETKKIEVKVED
jgi:HSP20 family protein